MTHLQTLNEYEEKVASMPQGPRWQEPVEQMVQKVIAIETPPTDRKEPSKLARKLLAVLPQACGDLHARLGKVNNWEFCFGYLAEGTDCTTCALREQCVGQGTQQPRTITVYPTQHRRWQENRAANRSEEYRQARCARCACRDHSGSP